MSGTPFTALKKACTEMAGSIFVEDDSKPDENMFEKVHTVFYGTDISSSTTNRKSAYLNNLNSAHCGGMTNFIICYEKIMKMTREAPEGT